MALTLFALVEFSQDEPKVFKRGEIAYKDNHVQACVFDRDLGVMKGAVQASMKKVVYEVNLYISPDGQKVSTASTCTCARGQHFCHHMIALGLHGINNISSTDSQCKWKKPKTPKEVKRISELYPPKKNFTALKNPLSEAFDRMCLEDLQKTSALSGMCWLLEPEVVSKVPEAEDIKVLPVEDLLYVAEYAQSEHPEVFLMEKLAVSQQQIMWVEERTRGQQKNPEWFKYRRCRITASNFGCVLSACSRNRFPQSLFKRLLGEYDLSHIKAVQWGINHESVAIAEYEMLTGQKVLPVGLVLHKCGCVGASPDGYVGDDIIIEIKCPYSVVEKGLTEHIHSGKFYLKMKEGSDTVAELDLTHKQGFDYFHQIQGTLYITGRRMCHLLVWTPASSRIVTINRDETWHTKFEIIASFYKTHFIRTFTPDSVQSNSQ